MGGTTSRSATRSGPASASRRRAGSTRWTTIRTLSTNASGYWKLNVTITSTTDFRFRWQPTDAYDAPIGALKTSEVQRATIKRRR